MTKLEKNGLYLIWIIAMASMFGSLFFSEVLGYAPCILCWYQRIFWYPLVILVPMGIMRADKAIKTYILGLVVPGFLIALYHTLLNWNVIPERLAPCTAGVSCITKYINWFGFINIPFLSFLGFLTIIGILWWVKKKGAIANSTVINNQ